jgi:hypothetical protein
MEPMEVSENRHKGGEANIPRSNEEAELFLGDDTNREQPTSTAFQRFSSYLNSYQVSELIFCLAICLVGFLFEIIGVEPRQRAIPYQELSTGEFALNQVYDQEYTGETISTLELLIYGIAFPFLLQL